MKQTIKNNFAKYVSLNILGMIGLSCYILADTFFISKGLGALGITALNFSISIYSLIHGSGLMIGIGGATRYSILKSKGQDKEANGVFTHSILLGVAVSLIFIFIAIFGASDLAILLGADETTLPMTKTYLTTILSFSPFFITNNVLLAFVRNDNNPNTSMMAMLTGSISNIILDYIFMFPLGMGMFGAAFATGLAPIISILVLMIHFACQKNTLRLSFDKLHLGYLKIILGLGLSSFITEVSSAVTLITFNLVILSLEGNLGVASYGIIANIALVAMSIFTGIAQGIQPLISREHGKGYGSVVRKILKMAIGTSLVVSVCLYVIMMTNSSGIVSAFNSEGNLKVANLAEDGLRIYFIGFFFAGINIIMATYLSSIERPMEAFLISILRGCVIIVPMVLILSMVIGMNGIWLSFIVTEIIVLILSFLLTRVKENENEQR